MKNRKHYTAAQHQNIRILFNGWFIFFIIRCSMIPIICLYSTYSVSKREKLHHAYIMFMFYISFIRKRETILYLQYVYGLDSVYQKEGNCIIHTLCLWSRLLESEKGKVYRTYSILMI